MALNIGQKNITSVQLIDDDPRVRETYKFHVEDLEADPNEITGQISDVASLLKLFDTANSAVICDFNLKVKNYSAINGDEIVAGLYMSSVPVVLCTRYGTHLPEAIRQRRRRIPVILTPDAVDADTLRSAFVTCVNEFSFKFSEARKPWRTLVRVEGGEMLTNGLMQVNAIIPEWDSSTFVSFDWQVTDNEAIQAVKVGIEKGDIVRVYATVNVGANSLEDLYVDDWSLKKTT